MIRVLSIAILLLSASYAGAIANDDDVNCGESYSLGKSWKHRDADLYAGMNEVGVQIKNFFDGRCVDDDLNIVTREEKFRSKIEAALKAGGYSVADSKSAKTLAVFNIYVKAFEHWDVNEPDRCVVRYNLRVGYYSESVPPWRSDPVYGFNEVAEGDGFGVVPRICVDHFVDEAVDGVSLFLNWLPVSGEQDTYDSHRNSSEN